MYRSTLHQIVQAYAPKVGFWRQRKEADSGAPTAEKLPWPGDLRDPSFDPVIREMVASYLADSKFHLMQYRGVSLCRLCGKVNGSADYSDGTYVWPEGYAHYVRAHSVRPPATLVQHIKSQRQNGAVQKPGLPPVKVAAMQVRAGEAKTAKATLDRAGLLGPWTNFGAAKKYGQAFEALDHDIDFLHCTGAPVPAALVSALARMAHAELGALDGKMAPECLSEHADRLRKHIDLRAIDGRGKIDGNVDVSQNWSWAEYNRLCDFILANYGRRT